MIVIKDIVYDLDEIVVMIANDEIHYPVLLVPFNAGVEGLPSYNIRDEDDLSFWGPKAFEHAPANVKFPKVHVLERTGYGKFFLEHSGSIENSRLTH